MERIPFIVFGDGPRLHSGLARIARDLAVRVYAEQEQLGIRLIQCGVDYAGGWHWQPWDFYGFVETTTGFGRPALEAILQDLPREPRPIVLAITDPSRTYDLTRWDETYGQLAADIWGYFPIDAENVNGRIGGPAAEAVASVQRVLAYGPYGAQILKRTLDQFPGRQSRVPYLPHGLEPGQWRPGIPISEADETFRLWAELIPTSWIVGAVATNQPRKDLGLLFQTVAKLQDQQAVRLWLHTDLMTKHWDVGQLAHDMGFTRDQVLVTTFPLTDTQLAARYCVSEATIAPGLGEGFGYPIVESLACGTPVVHGKYAGGVDLIPRSDYLVEPIAWRLESCYALRRPVFTPAAMANLVEGAITRRAYEGKAGEYYLSGSVAHLNWQHLWPRWRAWITQGLRQREPARETSDASA